MLSSSLALQALFFRFWTSSVFDAQESQPSFGRTYRSQTKSGGTLRQTSSRRSGRLKCGPQLSFASTQPGHGSDLIVFFFSFRLKPPANKFSPAPSNPHTIVPAQMPMATGAVMIVDSSPTPEAAKLTLAIESAVLIPSETLAPRRYFLNIEALKSRSFSRRNLASATC